MDELLEYNLSLLLLLQLFSEHLITEEEFNHLKNLLKEDTQKEQTI